MNEKEREWKYVRVMAFAQKQFRLVKKLLATYVLSPKPTSSYVSLSPISPPTMVTLEADGAPPRPPHPTMPLYSLRDNYWHSSELNFQVEQPKIPKEGDITSLSKKPHIKTSFRLPTTMAISMIMASHDITLPTVSTSPITSVSTSSPQHQHIAIEHGMGRTDDSQKHDMPCRKHTNSTNLQPPAKPQHGKMMKHGNIGEHTDLLSPLTGASESSIR